MASCLLNFSMGEPLSFTPHGFDAFVWTGSSDDDITKTTDFTTFYAPNHGGGSWQKFDGVDCYQVDCYGGVEWGLMPGETYRIYPRMSFASEDYREYYRSSPSSDVGKRPESSYLNKRLNLPIDIKNTCTEKYKALRYDLSNGLQIGYRENNLTRCEEKYCRPVIGYANIFQLKFNNSRGSVTISDKYKNIPAAATDYYYSMPKTEDINITYTNQWGDNCYILEKHSNSSNLNKIHFVPWGSSITYTRIASDKTTVQSSNYYDTIEFIELNDNYFKSNISYLYDYFSNSNDILLLVKKDSGSFDWDKASSLIYNQDKYLLGQLTTKQSFSSEINSAALLKRAGSDDLSVILSSFYYHKPWSQNDSSWSVSTDLQCIAGKYSKGSDLSPRIFNIDSSCSVPYEDTLRFKWYNSYYYTSTSTYLIVPCFTISLSTSGVSVKAFDGTTTKDCLSATINKMYVPANVSKDIFYFKIKNTKDYTRCIKISLIDTDGNIENTFYKTLSKDEEWILKEDSIYKAGYTMEIMEPIKNIFVNNDSSMKQSNQCYIRIDSEWKPSKKVYINIDGQWKEKI